MKTHTLQLLAVSAICLSLSQVFAADTVSSTTSRTFGTATDRAVPATAALPASRIASHFESLAGSPENAASLVAGLRSGSEITLSSPDSATGISFTPTTKPMGYGNITRALTLAQRQLAAQGITEPTPEQLNLALNGGTLTSVDSSGATRTVEMAGVLQLRSQGMGWGQIAHELAVSPGNRPPTTTATTATAVASPQAGVDLRGSSHRQGAIVSGDGAILHGRAPGFTGSAQSAAQSQGRAPTQANAQVQAGRPSFVTTGSSIGMGNNGKTPVQARGGGPSR